MVEAEPDAVEAVSAHQELLAGTSSQIGAGPVAALLGEAAPRRGNEVRALLFDRQPKCVVGEQLAEGDRCVAVRVDLVHDVALKLLEPGWILLVVPTARAVGEQPVVELVGRHDSGALDGLRHRPRPARDTCGEA